jgi:hypothetical protein
MWAAVTAVDRFKVSENDDGAIRHITVTKQPRVLVKIMKE